MEVQLKLDNKKKDIEKLQDKEKTLHATFTTSLGENNKFADFLAKVFKKKIKRSKKVTTGGEGRYKAMLFPYVIVTWEFTEFRESHVRKTI